MNKKNIGIIIAVVIVLILGGLFLRTINHSSSSPKVIKLGMLWSESGPTASTEKSMTDGAMLAVNEINKQGGIDGKKIQVFHEDYGGDPSTAATKMKTLLEKDKVNAVVGCDTSASRVAVLPILKKDNGLLLYPVVTEGKEVSPNVIYTGPMPNQTITQSIPYVMQKTQGKKVFLVGSDYIFPHTVNSIAKALIQKNGGTVVGEQYTPLNSTAWSSVISKIKQAKPDIIFSAAVGDSGVAFYKELKQKGIDPAKTSVIATALHEDQAKAMGAYYSSGIYTASSFDSYLDTDRAKAFVKKYNKTYSDGTVVTENAERAYDSVYLLKAAIEKSGQFTNTKELTAAFAGVSFNKSPTGTITVNSKNHCTELPYYINQIQKNGDWKVVAHSKQLVDPEPWPKVLYPNYKNGMPSSVAKQLN